MEKVVEFIDKGAAQQNGRAISQNEEIEAVSMSVDGEVDANSNLILFGTV